MPKRKTRAWTKAQKGKKVITNVESDPQAQEPLMSATGNGKESKTVPVNTKKVQDSKDETVGNRYPRAADEWRTEKSTSMPTKKNQKEPVQTDAQAPLASPVLGSGEDPKSPADTLTYNADTSVPMEEAKKDVQTQTDAQEPSTDGVEAMKVPAPGPGELIKYLEDALKPTQRIFSERRPRT
ncbi:hypothetical protein BDP27DRAFT_59434 [Rhodocollybia butyracea]|uniref:Uncharacterized protein n=1 Tax=Rhodocollybia butyracea TaxID=206335 RepID=A0A9P5U378_9AGAR|nr:hypothetical protein BDP27DRAFT_59434 [Rhodocollybia butyracea]